jgi:hypothetical protein
MSRAGSVPVRSAIASSHSSNSSLDTASRISGRNNSFRISANSVRLGILFSTPSASRKSASSGSSTASVIDVHSGSSAGRCRSRAMLRRRRSVWRYASASYLPVK